MSGTVSAEPLWKIKGAQIRQGRALWPTRPLDLEIPRGRVAVLGFSGAGKTSLLNLLVGFVPPAKGGVSSPASMAWVPQTHGLWNAHSVLEHLTMVGMAPDNARALLARFDLADRSTARADTLSIGEGARLAVARALAQSAPVIVMDEPLAHVDGARAGRYWQVIREHVRASGAALVFATHQPELALAEADHAICLRDGEVVFQGSVANLYHEPATVEAASFLGPANCFTPDQARHWLGTEDSGARCIRPERLVIEPAPEGFMVIASRFMGSYAESDLQHPMGDSRVFTHRPVSALPMGARVSVKVIPFA